MKDEVSDILDSGENVSEICMFSLINFALIVLVRNGSLYFYVYSRLNRLKFMCLVKVSV